MITFGVVSVKDLLATEWVLPDLRSNISMQVQSCARMNINFEFIADLNEDQEEKIKWCDENFDGAFKTSVQTHPPYILIELAEDAAMFKLKYSKGQVPPLEYRSKEWYLMRDRIVASLHGA